MSNKKNIYYNIDKIDEEDALFNIIYGERSGGKSYQAKHKKGIIPYLNSIVKDSLNKDRFILMRRWKEEITVDKIEQYLADIDVSGLTNNEYNCFVIKKKRIHLALYDPEDGKITTIGDHIGYVVALNTEQHYAGGSYLDVKNIIFEEFISRSAPYLADEPNKFLNFWNTVDRKRGVVRCWLLGNSISRICPYFPDWGLMDIVRKQKLGTIAVTYAETGTYDEENNPIKIKIAIEYCDNSSKQGITFGTHKNMLNKGEWQSDPQPHLPNSRKEYTRLFVIGFQFKTFKFIGELLQGKDNNIIWHIYPYDKKEFKKNTIIISDIIKPDRYYQRNIYDVTIKNERLHKILDTFRESNIFYATDLVGTDFKQSIDFTIKK